MLSDLGLEERWTDSESVSILVGPNGSGKSSFLRDLVNRYRHEREIVVVCNTPHDRFARLAGIRRISIGKTDGSPRVVVKNSVAQALSGSGEDFHRISSTLEYCGYHARFGFSIDRTRSYEKPSLAELLDRSPPRLRRDYSVTTEDLELAISFLQRHEPGERIWIDANDSVYDFSRSREFVSVLKLESRLRALGVIRGIRVFLVRGDGKSIEMQHASSGQLALISSLLFVITNARRNALIILDEPENSLHPNWQREYVDKLLAALSYRNATVIMATHAPLVVSGAITSSPNIVSVFGMSKGEAKRLPIEADISPASIEEILWQAFEVVTPANHFVSEIIVDAISAFEQGKKDKAEILSMIGHMKAESFDERQQVFFEAVEELVEKVEGVRGR
ncbi:AAA family ATPase [Asaia sp. BMEF1]|uniref:AAA family ATPase n=1 Tax=Asaia sp. BMEF1 TaxID=3155932 RepID=UPI003F661AC8